MNRDTFTAFGNELTKIAFANTIAKGFKAALREGWHGTAAAPNSRLNKGLMLLGTGLMAKDAIKPVDASGMERSRSERLTGLAGNTIGGMAGSSAMLRLMPNRPVMGGIVGGIAGGMLGEQLVTKPWARHRADRIAAQRRAYQAQPQGPMLPEVPPGQVPA